MADSTFVPHQLPEASTAVAVAFSTPRRPSEVAIALPWMDAMPLPLTSNPRWLADNILPVISAWPDDATTAAAEVGDR